uniref:Uncharacterized protein n=1 Tax=Setaria digitata TaxID=48799 RepID=A0A915PJH2_9BILA
MIRTVPLQSSPSPPPPSGTEVTSKNGSISGCMWKLRTEPRDGSNKNSVILKAEGIVEIPKPQSVASLREQIARKLEVKMPYTPPANSHPDSTMTTANCFTKSQRDSVMNGQFSHNLQNGAIPTSVLNTFGPTSNHKSSHQTTPLKQLSVVHEPVERHISCITPVPFNRTGTLSSSAIISSNMSVVATSPHSNIFSPSVIRDKYEDNNDYTDSPASDMGESNQLNDYEKLKPAKQKVDDEPQLSLPSAAASPAVIGAISSRIVTVSERATTVAVKLNPPPLIVNSYSKDGNEMTVRNTEIPASSINQSDIIQADKVRTDAYDIENQSGASSSSVVTTAAAPYEMPPFSKPVELRSKIKPETDSFRELQPKLQSKTPPVIINGLPSTPEGLKAISSTIPRYDAHTENSSWYRTMFRKMHIVDQSGKLFHRFIIVSKTYSECNN